MMNCVLIIASLIAGFLLGRIGSNVYDGLFVLGSRPGDHQVRLDLDDEDLPYCQFITLKVVQDEKE